MAESLSPYQFLKAAEKYPVVDVRTPSEFVKGHIPGALNLPLFSDDERAVVGTLYKKQGRNAAVLKGLEFVGPKMAAMAKEAAGLAVENKLLVHCWRGGMRSASMAWLFETVGISCLILEGGYKAYRASFREMILDEKWNFVVLGGPTGSGKTDVLKALEQFGEQVLDLEGLANHKGSAFGALGQDQQPTTEQFQNDIHEVLRKFDPHRPIWVEGESNSIGRVFIPDLLFDRLMKAPLIMFELNRERRLDRLVKEYGCFQNDLLAQSVLKIQKRLGGVRTQEALDALEIGDYRKVADITLQYYDKSYANSLSKRNKPVWSFTEEKDNPEATAEKLIKQLELCLQ
ncbi:tRNA 2-selenouridine(34) synthase MnmH [Thermophagus sp. OGC60D27]|uniref:tRNA 2-selenouridine(34) synthase MnmH n=1 Tax=Thermophagus sp. OGC60D27 TaxID=3458415 RepID=UPI0040382512